MCCRVFLAFGRLLAVVVVVASCGSSTPPSETSSQSASVLVQQPGAPQKIVYGEREDEQFGLLSLPAGEVPDGGHPVVVVIHGGFWSEPWDYTLMSGLAEDLGTRGYAAWNIEFGRVGGNGGYPDTFEDVGAAIDSLVELEDQYALDLQRTVVIGHSSGGHLALWALGRPDSNVRLVGAVGLAAVVDLEAFPQSKGLLGGTPETEPERYAAAAPTLDPGRVVLVHGERDGIVPLSTLAPAEALAVPISVIADADHFSVINPNHPAWIDAVTHIDNFLQ